MLNCLCADDFSISGGVNFYDLTDEQQYIFQKSLLKLMLSLEESFLEVAKSCGRRAVVIYDRGAMDCSAYMPRDQWLVRFYQFVEKQFHQLNRILSIALGGGNRSE